MRERERVGKCMHVSVSVCECVCVSMMRDVSDGHYHRRLMSLVDPKTDFSHKKFPPFRSLPLSLGYSLSHTNAHTNIHTLTLHTHTDTRMYI